MNVLKIICVTVAGGVAGYLWHRIVGCASGTCLIVKNPYLSTILGALLGLSFMMSR